MKTEELLYQRQTTLSAVIQKSFQSGSQHSRAFAWRILQDVRASKTAELVPTNIKVVPQNATYSGVPEVAALGFRLGAQEATAEEAQAFLAALRRLQHRPESALTPLLADDVALLGTADGLAYLIGSSYPDTADLITWLTSIIDKRQGPEVWTSRMRYLAGDLLDERARLQALPDSLNTDMVALDLALRRAWPHPYLKVLHPNAQSRETLLHHLLSDTPPHVGDLERAAVHMAAIDSLVATVCRGLVPSVPETARILADVQHSLKRWRWAEKSRRRITPSRWLIDDEYDVQALLWAVLYPIYRSDLVDETYLPSWGNMQPRVDLGITSLKLIIEVKIAREPGDYKQIEEQVAGDEGMYFKDTSQFDRMLVFVYDDCDKPQPERHESLRNALAKRERIEDVIIIQRPSMMPNRNARGNLMLRQTDEAEKLSSADSIS